MNEVLLNPIAVLFAVTMITSLSHIWQKSVYLLAMVCLLWAVLVAYVALPIDSIQSSTLLDWMLAFSMACFFPAYFIMKYVDQTPIWRPLTYAQFTKALERSSVSVSYKRIADILLIVFFIGLLFVVLEKLR